MSLNYYRVFGGRLISEVMLMDGFRALAGKHTVAQMAALAGLSPADSDPRKLFALFRRYGVPYRPTTPPQLVGARERKSRARHAAAREGYALAWRLAEIAQARAEAPAARPFKVGRLEW